jgi:hypothetical protein
LSPHAHGTWSDTANLLTAWLSRAGWDGSLAGFLKPDLTPPERTMALVEAWILGVPGLIRADEERPAHHCGVTRDV